MAIQVITRQQQRSNDLPGSFGRPDQTETFGGRYGVPNNEVGINIRRFQVRYFPEQDEKFGDFVGNTIVRAVSDKFSRDIECEGEIAGGGGVMAFTIAIVCNFANRMNEFNPIGGSVYLDDATVLNTRNGWRSVTVRASAKATL